MLARWQTAGERWLTATRRTTRVVSGGAALKVDALADTLTFHAVEEMEYRGRAAAQWVAQAPVRVLESQVRGARGAEGGIEAGLLVSRVVDLDNGQTLAVQVGAFSERERAERVSLEAASTGPSQVIPLQRDGRTLFRVTVGPLADEEAAALVRRRLGMLGYEDARVISAP